MLATVSLLFSLYIKTWDANPCHLFFNKEMPVNVMVLLEEKRKLPCCINKAVDVVMLMFPIVLMKSDKQDVFAVIIP